MADPRTQRLVDDYFTRLEAALAPLPPAQRSQLFEELKSHVEQARMEMQEETEVAILDLLDRLGNPQDIADQAFQDYAYDTEEIDVSALRQAKPSTEADPQAAVEEQAQPVGGPSGRSSNFGWWRTRESRKVRVAAVAVMAVILASLLYLVLPIGSKSGARPSQLAVAVEPNAGQNSCGTIVSISGSGFGPPTEVEFGTTMASMVKVVSPHLVTAMSPAMTPGTTVEVTVWNGPGPAPAAATGDAARRLRFSYYSSPVPGGYRLMSADGAIYSYGNDCYLGAPVPGSGSGQSLVSLVSSIDGRGYWEVSSKGSVEGFGDVSSYFPKGRLTSRVVGLAPTANGDGYWLVDSRGDVVACGDATAFTASKDGQPHNLADSRTVVSVAPDDGKGLWLLWSDGSVTGYGNAAPLLPSEAAPAEGRPVAIAATPDGQGYWILYSDGSVIGNGEAITYGLGQTQPGGISPSTSATGTTTSVPVSIVAAPGGTGYWVFRADGSVDDYGSAQAAGSIGGTSLPSPIVSAAG